MPLKLIGHPFSPSTEKVKLALLEKGIPFENHEINFSTAEHKSPEHLKLQPFGIIPVLDDDGFTIYESRAIVRYIEHKYKGTGAALLPDEPKAFGLAEQGAYLETSSFDPPASSLAYELVFKKGGNPNHVPNPELVAAHRAKLTKVLKIYDQILAKQPYIGGETFTIADLYHMPYMLLLTRLGEGEHLWKGLTNVEKWFSNISQRESVKALSK